MTAWGPKVQRADFNADEFKIISADLSADESNVNSDWGTILPLRVFGDSVAHLPGQIQPLPVQFKHIDYPQALLVVVEPAGHQVAQHVLTGVTERRMPQIVAEDDGLGQIFVQLKDLGDGSRDLRDLEGMRESRAVVIARGGKEHLGFVLKPSKCLAVHDSITVTLKDRTNRIFSFGTKPSPRLATLGRVGGQVLPFACFQFASNRHGVVGASGGLVSGQPRRATTSSLSLVAKA